MKFILIMTAQPRKHIRMLRALILRALRKTSGIFYKGATAEVLRLKYMFRLFPLTVTLKPWACRRPRNLKTIQKRRRQLARGNRGAHRRGVFFFSSARCV